MLPAPLAPLIGRDDEIEMLAGVLRSGRHRLLTLAGAGGVYREGVEVVLFRSVP